MTQNTFEADESLASSGRPETRTKTEVTQGGLQGKPAEGAITKSIGTGENAKNSFIWITIRYSFIGAGLISIALYWVAFLPLEISSFFLDGVKDVWAIFMPVITLALGYAFGRRDSE